MVEMESKSPESPTCYMYVRVFIEFCISLLLSETVITWLLVEFFCVGFMLSLVVNVEQSSVL